MLHLDKKIKKNIFNRLDSIIDTYANKSLSIKYLKKYFSNPKRFSELVSDINEIESENFESMDEYRKLVREILNDILEDREALEKDKNSKKKKEKIVENFSNFLQNNLR
jgi:hypothetical protein